MENGSEYVVPELTLRKGLVATLVGKYPYTSSDGARSIPVKGPKDVLRPLGKRGV